MIIESSFLTPIFLGEIIILYFISKLTVNELFYFLRIFIKGEKYVFSLVSLFFLPGTILHELAHFFMATILLMRVHEVKVLPEWEKNYIKLGRVLYEKKDFVRGVIVGIAPILLGLVFFWWLAFFKIFPSNNLPLNIILGYFILTISSTMFSSKQDLVDLIYIIPVIIITVVIFYIFNIRIDFLFKNQGLVLEFFSFIRLVDYYLFFSILINLLIILVFRSFRNLIKK